MSIHTAMAQKTLTQTGHVYDVTGQPLVGVHVIEKGTANGALTDINGAFTVAVKKGATLVFSYVGYIKKEFEVSKGAPITIEMDEDSELLDGVVVIGYGTVQRRDLTSSITTVRSKDLGEGAYTDAISMLQGRVAGLFITTTSAPDGTPTITLRGPSSLRTDAMSPYYIVDGIPGVDISMVSPEDIETIDVLRDATATAIYGSKAANGVIIITTKHGHLDQEKIKVTYSGYTSFDRILNNLDMASADDLRWYANTYGVTLKDGGANTDWQKAVQRNGLTTSQNIAFCGGSSRSTYSASITLLQRRGVITGSGMHRMNARAVMSTKVLKDHVDISLGATVMSGKHYGTPGNSKESSVLNAMNYYSPTQPAKDENGDWTLLSISGVHNPLSLIFEDRYETAWNRQQYIGKVQAKIIDGLTLNANYSYLYSQSTYSAFDSSKSQIEGVSSNGGLANRSTSMNWSHTLEVYGTYDHTFAKKHKMSLMGGYTFENKTTKEGFGVTVYNFYDDTIGWNNLSYASSIDGIEGVTSDPIQEVRNISFYGRGSYTYDGRYLLQATVRRDGSSVFAKGNRWGVFPSISVAWNVTDEKFWHCKWVDNLKLRLGYGTSGNAMGFDAYTTVATYGATGYFQYNGTQWRTLGATKNANPDLKWESTSMLNFGVDFGFMEGRLSGSLEIYKKHTDDLIWNYPVSTNIYPYESIDANVGEIDNHGIELTLTAIPFKGKKWEWHTTLTLTHNTNEVVRLSNARFSVGTFTQGDPKVTGVSSNGYTQRIIEGQPLGTFYTYEFAGYDAQGVASYYTRNANTGQRDGGTTSDPTYKDRTITGCAQPDLTVGWNNQVTYGHWNASCFFLSNIGNDIYNGSRANYTSTELYTKGVNVLKEFIYERPVTDNLPNLPSDRFLEDGSYLRLQSLTLGYTFTKLKNWVQSVQLYTTLNNVFTLTSYKGLDPEVNMNGLSPGIEYPWSAYPHTRAVLLGMKVNF